ncbi:hypothetical protein FRB97_008275 [Tulasnella sp. 331]|nr:hypothetical protein FRB97_008275 [Tulasnella sp. 331]
MCDISTGNVVGNPMIGHTSPVWCVAWSPNDQTIVSGSWDHTLRFWDASTQKNPIGTPLLGHAGPVRCVAWSPDGKTIVSGSYDETLRLWDASTGGPIRAGQCLADIHTHSVYRLAFAANLQKIVSASADGTLRLRDPVQVSTLEFSLDGKYVLSEDEEA